MNNLSDKSYWTRLHIANARRRHFRTCGILSNSFQNHEYFNILQPYIKKTFKTVLEVGCAPGNQLIRISKRFNLTPYGVEYTKEGKEQTEKNLEANGVKNYKIFYTDFFDRRFQKENRENFDIVFSNGFIEHFDDLQKVIRAHANLTKKEGLVIIGIPNLLYTGRYLVSANIKTITNFNAMNIRYLQKNIPPSLKVEYLNYYGFFNLGVFFFNNFRLETIRFFLFVLQRMCLDPILIFFSKSGLRCNWKYTSPAIVLILKKIK